MLSKRQAWDRTWPWSALALTVAVGLTNGASGADETSEATTRAPIEVTVTDGLLSIEAVASLGEILQAIGQAAGFQVVVEGVVADPIRVSFVNRPLRAVIQELAAEGSLIMVRDDTGALSEIRVFGGPVGAEDEHEVGTEGETEIAHRPLDPVTPQDVPEPLNREDLIWALGAAEQSIQEAALPKVSSLPPGEAVRVLSDVYAADTDLRMRSRTVAALTRIKSGGATALLQQWALNDGDPELRMQALTALATTAGERAITTLGRALRVDPELRVRETALRALQRVGGPWARGYLERVARQRTNPLQAEAAQAIARFSLDRR